MAFQARSNDSQSLPNRDSLPVEQPSNSSQSTPFSQGADSRNDSTKDDTLKGKPTTQSQKVRFTSLPRASKNPGQFQYQYNNGPSRHNSPPPTSRSSRYFHRNSNHTPIRDTSNRRESGFYQHDAHGIRYTGPPPSKCSPERKEDYGDPQRGISNSRNHASRLPLYSGYGYQESHGFRDLYKRKSRRSLETSTAGFLQSLLCGMGSSRPSRVEAEAEAEAEAKADSKTADIVVGIEIESESMKRTGTV